MRFPNHYAFLLAKLKWLNKITFQDLKKEPNYSQIELKLDGQAYLIILNWQVQNTYNLMLVVTIKQGVFKKNKKILFFENNFET